MRFLLASLGAASLTLVGCGDDLGCDDYCARSVECQITASTLEVCVQTCDELSAESEAYAEAIEVQAECFEDATCGKIRGGACTTEDIE